MFVLIKNIFDYEVVKWIWGIPPAIVGISSLIEGTKFSARKGEFIIMPILETSDAITPRSAIRHRPIGKDTSRTGKQSIVTNATTPIVQRASRPRPHIADTQEDVAEWQRIDDERVPTSQVEPHSTQVPVRRASATPSQRQSIPTTKQSIPTTPKQSLSAIPQPRLTVTPVVSKRHAHPLLYLGLGMLAMLVMWTVLIGAINWFNTTMDDIHYGRPRTFQTDHVVGHNDSQSTPSHFIAINLHSHIEIIEMPGGDASHARIYMGPQLYNVSDELVPVTLKFADLNGDHLADMIICFQGSRVVFINDHGGFRPLHADERHQIEQALQRLQL